MNEKKPEPKEVPVSETSRSTQAIFHAREAKPPVIPTPHGGQEVTIDMIIRRMKTHMTINQTGAYGAKIMKWINGLEKFREEYVNEMVEEIRPLVMDKKSKTAVKITDWGNWLIAIYTYKEALQQQKENAEKEDQNGLIATEEPPT